MEKNNKKMKKMRFSLDRCSFFRVYSKKPWGKYPP